MTKFTDQDKKKLIYDIANYIIDEFRSGKKVSARSVAENFLISYVTVLEWMNKDLKLELPDLYPVVNSILKSNRSLLSDKKIQKRVLKSAELVLKGYKYQDIIDYYKSIDEDSYYLTDKMIYHDLNVFLPQIDKELYDQIKEYLTKNSLDNLTPGNDQAINQERDRSGRFM